MFASPAASKALVSLLVLTSGAIAGEFLTGYRQHGLQFRGPGEWRYAAEPVWVYEYHTLRLRYRASGLPKGRVPLLTLRPGAVGPVTPGATNRENPFAAGHPVVVVTAEDLGSDGKEHTTDIELRPKMLTAQIDELLFSLPAGARLDVRDLEFLAEETAVPCRPDGAVLPAGGEKLAALGPLTCGGFPATSLRGREAIRIEGGGRTGRTVYLSLMAHEAGLSNFVAGRPVDSWRVKECRETAHMVARVKYADGTEEEQFPLLVAERRHALVNRRPALYALAIEARPLASVELLDRSPHLQLLLFGAGLSRQAPPVAADESPLPPAPARRHPAGTLSVQGSPWFRVEPAQGHTAAGLRPDLKLMQDGAARLLTLAVTNTGAASLEFTLVFPAVEVASKAAPRDVYYLYPRQGAVLSNADARLEDPYGTRFPLQFLDVFSPASNDGICLLVRDTGGRFKTFRLSKRGTSTSLEVRYPVRLAPGETYRAPEAALVTHGGGWREGFEAYRQWLATWYKPAGPRPAWLRSAFWARRDYPVGGSGHLFDVRHNRYTFTELIRDGQAFGGIDFIDISGWALSDTVGRVGDYPIELGGPDDLRRNIALAFKSGIPTGLYFEGYLIDRNSAIGRRSGEAWQMVDAAGRRMWWPGGSPELFACPLIPAWQSYLAGRAAAVAASVGAHAVYLDEHGMGTRRCFAPSHGHPAGAGVIPGEIQMARQTRQALDRAGLPQTMIYTEYSPVDAAAPYCDAAFCYALQQADARLSPAKLNLWRFAFPDIRLWDMVSVGVHPRALPPEDFRLSLWHGNGAWLKGHSDTWYGPELLASLRRARWLLKEYAAAFAGQAEPLVDSPHPAVVMNRFRGGGRTVCTLFNTSFRTVRFSLAGRQRVLGPRDVDVVGGLE